MKIYFFSLLLVIGTLTSLAKAQENSVLLYPLNYEIRYENDEDREGKTYQPFNFALGYQGLRWSGLLQYSRLTDETGNSTSSLERTHQDVILWMRYHLAQFQYPIMSWSFLAGAGGGAYQEQVKSTLMGDSREDQGSWLMLSGLMVGVQSSFPITEGWAVLLSAEGQALFAADFDPNPLWVGVLRLGLSF
ncbi:MAG: hypothetical protein AAGB31_00465 [Bdellovibrio sp.]